MQNLSHYKAKKGTAIKSTAVFVAVLFLFTDILFFPSQALGQIPSSSIVQGGESLAGFQSQPLYENGWLPPELGSINEVYRAPGNGEQATGSDNGETDNASGQRPSLPIPRNDRMIVFIQDAHDSLEGQENIAKIIRLLTERYGVATVFQEGYEGPVPTDDLFRFIEDPALKEKISYFFLDKLRLRGAEYAHINRQSGLAHGRQSTDLSQITHSISGPRTMDHGLDWTLIGADSLKLHQDNIDQYRLSAEKKETIGRDLSAIEKELKLLAARRFPKEFREWMKVKEQFDAKKLDLFTYLERTLPLVLGGKRQAINEKQADLNANRLPFTPDAATPLLRFILEAVRSNNPVVLEKAKHIDAREVFAELLKLEQMIAETYLADGEGGTRPFEARSRMMDLNADLQLYDHYKTLQLLKRLNSLEVTQEEYAALLVQPPASGVRHDTPFREAPYHLEVSTQCLAEFIHSQTKKPLVLSKQWERNIQDAVKFYEIALQRDNALSTALGKYFPADQSTQYSKLSGVKPAILVYGGFHKENIKRILEAKGISYVVVSPRITQPSPRHEAYYKQLMTDGFHKFELPFLLRTAASQPTLLNLDPQVARAEIRAVYEAAIRYPNHPETWERHLDSTDPGSIAREISPALESIQEVVKPTRTLEKVDRRSEVRGEADGKKRNSLFQMSRHSLLKMGLLFFAVGLFSMAHVGGAQPSIERTIFRQGSWNVLGTRDTGPASEKIRTSAGLHSEIKIVNGRHQIFSVKGNGFLRGTLPGMDWGTSFVLPGYWSQGRYFHNPRITHASFDLDEKGELRLKGVFEDQNGNFVADDFEVVFSTAPRGEALMKVSFTMKAKKDFTLDQERLRNHDGFRFAQFSSMFSSMNVGSVHDADTAEYEDETGERIETKLENKNQFIFSEPRPLGPARTFYLKNKNPVSGRNNPTTYIRLAESMDPSQFTPQGWVTESQDVNDDNVGGWIHFDAAKAYYRSGEKIGRFDFVLGIAPNRSETRNQLGEMEEGAPALTTHRIQGRELQDVVAFLDREWPDFETINIGEQNGKTISVKDTLESELPAARFAFEKMMQLRGWMDRNGKENVPLVIWQNMRLGELYPYLGPEIKKSFGILELTKEQYRHLAYSPNPIPGEITASRYLLIKDKVPSSFPSEGSSYDGSPEEEWDSSLVLWLVKDIKLLGEKLKAPVLMIDHSSRSLSGAQEIVKAGEKGTAIVFEESPGSFQAIKTTLDKNGTALVILNVARGAAVRPGASVFDRFDSLFLEKNPEKKVRVSGQELSFFDAFRKVYEAAILKEALLPEAPDRSQKTPQLPALAEIRAVTPKNTSRARHWYFLNQLFRYLFFPKVLGLDFSQGEHRVVDVGVGALPVTTVEMAERFQKEISGAISTGRIEMIGIEIPEAVPYAHITAEGLTAEKFVDKFRFRLSERPMEESLRRWDLKAITLTINGKKEVTGAFASFDSENGTHYRDVAISQEIPYLSLERFYKGRQGDLLKEMIEFLGPEKIRYALSQGVSGTFDGISVELDPVRNMLEKAGVKLVVTDNPWSAGVRDVRLMTVFNVIQHIPQAEKLPFLEKLAKSLKEGKADEHGKLTEMGGILALKGGRLDGTPSFAETYYTNVNGHLVEIETTPHNFNHAVMSGQELGGFSVNFEERKLKPVWISSDGARDSRSEVRTQQELRDKGEFIASLADASLRLTRYLHDNDFHAVLASGDSAEIPLRLVTTAWQTLYPDEPFPLQFVFDGQENSRLYRDWAAVHAFGTDTPEEQSKFLNRAKELIDGKKSPDGRKQLIDFKEGKLVFIDTLMSTGFKTGMLKMIFKRLGFKNISYAILWASDPQILRVLHPDVFVAESARGKIDELGDLDHDLSVLRKNEPARVKLTMEEIQATLTLVQKAITSGGLSPRSELRSDFPKMGKSFFPMERFRSMEELRLTDGRKIPVSVTQKHHEIIEWIKSLQKQGIATPETTLVNFDAHPDTVYENLHEGSWVYWIREPERKTGSVISKGRMVWVRGKAYEPTLRGMWPDELKHGYGSLKENIFKDGADQLKGHLSGPAIITLDLDFLGSSDERTVSLKEVEERIQSFLRAVFESEIQPIAFHISISEKYLAKVRDYMDLPAGMAPRRDEAISQVLVEGIQLKGMRFGRQGTDVLFEPRSEIRSSLNDPPEGVLQAENQEGPQVESDTFQISQDPDFPEILNRVKMLLESYKIPGRYPEDESIRSLLTVVLDPRISDSGKQDKIRECLPSLARKFLSDLCRQIEEIGFPLSAKVMTAPDLIQRLDEFLLRPARQAYEQGKLKRTGQLLEMILSVNGKAYSGGSDPLLLELFEEAKEIESSLHRIEAWFARRVIDDKGTKVIRPTDLPATIQEWEAFSQEERKIIQRARANGEKLKWFEKMHNALIEPVINRAQRINNLQKFIVQGRTSLQKQFAMTVMIITNWMIDLFFIYPLVKMPTIAGALWLGRATGLGVLQVAIVAGAAVLLNMEGGLVRLFLIYPVFKLIWPKLIHLNRKGLIVNFVPSGPGNFAPFLFFNPTLGIDMPLALKERYLISRQVEKALAYYPGITEKIIVDITEAIYQAELQIGDSFNYRRFKIRRAKEKHTREAYTKKNGGESKNPLISFIKREDLSNHFPFYVKLKDRFFRWVGFPAQGYRKGTRPTLLIGDSRQLKKIKQFLKSDGLSEEQLGRVYQLDLAKYFQKIGVSKKTFHGKKPLAGEFIQPMFPTLEENTHQPQKGQLKKTAQNPKGLGNARPGGGKKNRSELRQSSHQGSQVPDVTWEELKQQGYDLYVSRDQKKGEDFYEWVGVVKKDGRILEGSNFVLQVFPKSKFICILLFFPAFPIPVHENDKNGKGRALLRELLALEDYTGYSVVSMATGKFPASLAKMKELHPVVELTESPWPMSLINSSNPEIQEKIKTLYEGVENADDVSDDEKDEVLGALGEATFIGEVTAPFYGLPAEGEETQGRSESRSNLAASLDASLNQERMQVIIDAMEEFREIESSEGNEIPWISPFGSFRPSNIQMIQDLVHHFDIGTKRKKILETGFGDGLTAAILAAATDADVVGIEPDPDRFQVGADFLEFLKIAKGIELPNLQLLQEDLLDHEIDDYDLIYFYYTPPLGDRESFPEKVLAKMEKSLKAESVFVAPILGSEDPLSILDVETRIVREFIAGSGILAHRYDRLGTISTSVFWKKESVNPNEVPGRSEVRSDIETVDRDFARQFRTLDPEKDGDAKVLRAVREVMNQLPVFGKSETGSLGISRADKMILMNSNTNLRSFRMQVSRYFSEDEKGRLRYPEMVSWISDRLGSSQSEGVQTRQSSMENGQEEKRFVPGATDRVESAGSLLRDSQGVVFSENDLQEKMSLLFSKAGIHRRNMKGLITRKGVYFPSAPDTAINVLRTMDLSGRKRAVILDAGHGQGELVFYLAKMIQLWYPDLEVELIGIEFEDEIFDESMRLLEVFKQEELPGKISIQFHQGDFNSEHFEPLFQKADYVYYFSKGTNDIRSFARTLETTMNKPGAKIVEYGEGELAEYMQWIHAPVRSQMSLVSPRIQVHEFVSDGRLEDAKNLQGPRSESRIEKQGIGIFLQTRRVEYSAGKYHLRNRNQSFSQWRSLARSVLRILETEFDNLAIQGISADREREVRQILQNTRYGLVLDTSQIVSLRNREIRRRLNNLRNALASNNREIFLSVVRGLNQLRWLQEPELLSTVKLFRGLRDIAENKWQVADSPQRMNGYLDQLEARLQRVDTLGWLFQRFVSKYVELRSGENPLSHEDAQKKAFETTVAQGNFDFTRQSDNRTLLLFYQLIFVSSREHSEFLESISRIAGQQAFKAPGRVPDDTSQLATWMPNDLYLWAPQVVLEALSKFEPLRSELRQPKETGKYFLLNKPVGFITTEKQEPNAPHTPIAWDLLPPDVKNGRHFLGRLDKDTSGLLLVGGNAELNQLLLNPKRNPDHKVRKTYEAVVGGHVTEASVNRLKQGVIISAEGKKYLVHANELRILERFWEGKRPLTRLEIVISEGKFHQVRTMLRVVGHQVLELQRTAFGPILLGNLAPGSWRELSSDEYNWLSGRLSQSPVRSSESALEEEYLDPLTGNREPEDDLPRSDDATTERGGELRGAGGKTPGQHFSSSASSTQENIAELEKPAVFVIEKGQIEGMPSSELRQLMVFAAINRKNLWLVVPDMLEGSHSQFLEDLKTLGVRISQDLPEIARSSGVRVIGFSDKETDTAGKLRMRLAQKNPRLAKGVKEYFAFEGGNGFFLAQLVSQPGDLAVMNGFRYDKAGRFQAALHAFLNHLMNSYVVTAISA